MIQNIIVGHAIHCSFIVANMWHSGSKKTWRQHWEVGRGRLQDGKDSGCSCFQITIRGFKMLGENPTRYMWEEEEQDTGAAEPGVSISRLSPIAAGIWVWQPMQCKENLVTFLVDCTGVGLFHSHDLIWSCCLVWMRRAKNCRNCQSWECMFAAEHYPAHSKAVSADELRSPLLRFGGTAIAWSSLSTLVSIFRHFQHKTAPLPSGEAGC